MVFLGLLAMTPFKPVIAGDWSGYVAGEGRVFPNPALQAGQENGDVSLAAQVSFHQALEKNASITVTPFARWDNVDRSRSHADMRELYLDWYSSAMEFRVGIRKVFWGVTESVHLVDIINQTDLVESVDGEEKLGQPMLNLSLPRSWGMVDVFVLPAFRERTFPGDKGRFRFALPIDTDNAQYESGEKQNHVDYALRYFHTLGDWDVGLSYFNGTSRAPYFQPVTADGTLKLLPYYPLIQQTGLDLQWVTGAWLWKLESIYRSSKIEDYYSGALGFEYTLAGMLGSRTDLGLIAEWIYDDRGADATTPFYRDIMLGLRFALNDAASSDALLGVIHNVNTDSQVVTLEANRRLGENWKLSLKGGLFSNIDRQNVIYDWRNDDYLQLSLARYF